MADVNMAKARRLSTEPELRLVEASRPQAIRTLTEPQLKSKIARARGLRDKWQDMFTRQRRDVQQDRKSRAVAASDRSREKSELFDAVLARFEAQLERGAAAGSSGGRRARPSKEKRGRGHRRTRSSVKRDLTAQMNAWESEGGARRPAGRAAAAEKETAEAAAKGARRAAGGRKAAKKTKGAASKGTKKKPAAPKAGRTRGKATGASNAPAGGTSKRRTPPVTRRERIMASSPARRTRGHALARGQRTQARRDRRR